MMHKRRWCVSTVATPQELARMLTERTWTLCSGFIVQGHPDVLFVNDATHEDGAGEWGVVRRIDSKLVQVESITMSWASYEQALQYIEDALAGKMDGNDFARPVTLHLDTPAQHGRCHLCA
ncbi:MAG: hypothetical protein L0Z50_39265 [Verrucomicrobiales bacterium]|nr:hypothetical protein [Verrucomicrobiales bacterium]